MSLASPFHHTAQGPADEVDALLDRARRVTDLSPTLNKSYSKHHDLFLDVLERHIQILKSRSQALEDAHITVYDKVLLRLTDNGNNLDNPAAITWYCEEYFGFDDASDTNENTRAIEQGLALPVALLKGLPAKLLLEDSLTKWTVKRIPNTIQPTIPLPARPVSPIKQRTFTSTDPSLDRLCMIFEKARDDYFDVADARDGRTFAAVRFLRDTAENGVQFLRGSRNADQNMLLEFQNTFNLANNMTSKLAAERKRKFEHDSDSEHQRRPGHRSIDVDIPARERFGRASRPYRRGPHYPGDRSPVRSPIHSPVRSPRRSPSRGFQFRGRGQSYRPYGYAVNRRVDSYVPARDGPARGDHYP